MSRPAGHVTDGSQELVNEMRSLVRASGSAPVRVEGRTDQRQATLRITTALMVLLVLVLFATSALPDLLPRLHNVVPAGFGL